MFLEVLGDPRIKNKVRTEFKHAAIGNTQFPRGWTRVLGPGVYKRWCATLFSIQEL